MPDSRSSRLPEPLARCPFCAAAYVSDQVRLIGRRRSGETSHATCLACSRAMMFAVDRASGHVACVGLLTDCNAEEAARFEKGAKISLDEVLRAHVELRK